MITKSTIREIMRVTPLSSVWQVKVFPELDYLVDSSLWWCCWLIHRSLFISRSFIQDSASSHPRNWIWEIITQKKTKPKWFIGEKLVVRFEYQKIELPLAHYGFRDFFFLLSLVPMNKYTTPCNKFTGAFIMLDFLKKISGKPNITVVMSGDLQS